MKCKITLIVGLIFFYSCNAEKGIPTDYSAACNLENNDKILEIAGYLSDAGSVYCSSTSGRFECGFKLLDDPKSSNGLSVDIRVGSSSNSVEELESGYSQKDIKIHDEKGEIISFDKKVTLTGKIRTVKDPDTVCYLKVSKIEVK